MNKHKKRIDNNESTCKSFVGFGFKYEPYGR